MDHYRHRSQVSRFRVVMSKIQNRKDGVVDSKF